MAGRAPTPATSCRGEVEYRSSSWRRCQHRVNQSLVHPSDGSPLAEVICSFSARLCRQREGYFVCLEFVGALPPFIVLSFASLPAQVWSLHEKHRWACRHGPYQVPWVKLADCQCD
nr:uncharacterized protein LOC109777247 isoform X2 [Aegilops tauschii subsp. strangulata]